MSAVFNSCLSLSVNSVSFYSCKSSVEFFNQKLPFSIDDQLKNSINSLVESFYQRINFISSKNSNCLEPDLYVDYNNINKSDGFFHLREYLSCVLLAPYLIAVPIAADDPYYLKISDIFKCSEIVQRNNIFYYFYRFRSSFKILVFGGRTDSSETKSSKVLFAFIIDYLLNEFIFFNPREVSILVPVMIYSDFYNLSLCEFYVDRYDPVIDKIVSSFLNGFLSNANKISDYYMNYNYSVDSRLSISTLLSNLSKVGISLPAVILNSLHY